MKPQFYPPSGRAYQAAVGLLAPLMAALHRSEFEDLVGLIKSSHGSTLVDVFDDFGRANAIMATSVLMTRFSDEPGMSEASESVFMSSMYMDDGLIYPPQNAKYENSILEDYFPDFAAFIDASGDVLQNMLLSEDNSLKGVRPLLNDDKTPMFTKGLYDVLDNTFKAIDPESEARVAAANSATAASGSIQKWMTDGAATALKLIGK